MNHRINSIVRATNILKLLSQGVNSFTDIVNRLDMKKSTVHGLIKTLEYEGFVIQNTINRHYYLGPLILKLGSNPYNLHQHLVSLSKRKMENLRDLTGETVVLDILLGTDVFALEVIPSKEDIAYIRERGSSMPVYIGAGARTLLSQLSDNDVEVITRNLTLTPITQKTVIEKTIFTEQVKLARREGYYISYGEKSIGSIGISVPIQNYLYPASITVLGPEYRLQQRSTEVLKELKQTSDDLGQKLKEYLFKTSK